MADRLTETIEKAELAVGSASGVLEEEQLRPLMSKLTLVRARASFPDDVVVVALAGGTGSGKSSLFNAIVGEDLVDVGGVRPTTQTTAAAVPAMSAGRFDGYLDEMGIDERFTHSMAGFVLIDLPDTDSVAAEHQHRVDQVLPMVDVVVWVVDPEKYRDARLHAEYLNPLAAYGDQFVFALNQIDRLDPVDLDALVTDLGEAVRDDGIDEPVIMMVAALPSAGPPIGVEELVTELAVRGQAGDAVTRKLILDLGQAARTLSLSLAGGVDFDERASLALGAAVGAMIEDRSEDAVSSLVGLLDEVAVSVEPATSVQLRRLAADVQGHVSRIAEEMRPRESPRRWWQRRTDPEAPDADTTRRLLSEATIRPARVHLARRALAIASIADLVVELERWRETPSR